MIDSTEGARIWPRWSCLLTATRQLLVAVTICQLWNGSWRQRH
jgi:hypothetical protein